MLAAYCFFLNQLYSVQSFCISNCVFNSHFNASPVSCIQMSHYYLEFFHLLALEVECVLGSFQQVFNAFILSKPCTKFHLFLLHRKLRCVVYNSKGVNLLIHAKAIFVRNLCMAFLSGCAMKCSCGNPFQRWDK
jgi:hypothetical protein